jgi:hypothetical protein
MPSRRRDEYTFPPEWMPRRKRTPDWLKRLAIDYRYTTKIFLCILAVFMIGVPIACLIWYLLVPPPRVEDLVRIQGRLRSYERHVEVDSSGEITTTTVDLRMLIEGRVNVFVVPSYIFERHFDYRSFSAEVRTGDVLSLSVRRKDVAEPVRAGRIDVYGLSSGKKVYLSVANALRWYQSGNRIWLLAAGIGFFMLDVGVAAVGVRDAALRAG